jgi:hypothetical protein
MVACIYHTALQYYKHATGEGEHSEGVGQPAKHCDFSVKHLKT